jgi:hypothetical protein
MRGSVETLSTDESTQCWDTGNDNADNGFTVGNAVFKRPHVVRIVDHSDAVTIRHLYLERAEYSYAAQAVPI